MAVIGLGLLSLDEGFAVNKGDMLVLACAATYAFHIVILDKVTDKFNSLDLAMVQIAFAGALMVLLGAALEPRVPDVDSYALYSIIITAVLATILAFFVQTFAQKHIGPTRTALILLTEPIFAAIFGYILLSEILTGRRLVGAIVLLMAMVISEIFGKAKSRIEYAEM